MRLAQLQVIKIKYLQLAHLEFHKDASQNRLQVASPLVQVKTCKSLKHLRTGPRSAKICQLSTLCALELFALWDLQKTKILFLQKFLCTRLCLAFYLVWRFACSLNSKVVLRLEYFQRSMLTEIFKFC